MYLRILKKDLKRKKATNIIILLFVILSSMFASSSVNNILTVVNGLDYFFDKAGMTDYYIIATEQKDSNVIEDILKSKESVSDYKKEDIIFCSESNIKRNNKKLTDFSSVGIVMPVDNSKINYFDNKNQEISKVEKGKAYLSSDFVNKAELKVGDKFTISINEKSVELEFAGILKDALLGSQFMGNPRFLLNNDDYESIYSDAYKGGLYYVNTDNVDMVKQAIANQDNILFSGDRAMIKTSYIMSMIVAGLLMIVSICLILVSFVVLKFTIGFTLEEEFREIGVMKALGIRNFAIRTLYLVKYFGIAIVGASIGFVLSVPFGNMMLSSVSENMVIGNDSAMTIGGICSLGVIGLIMLFCFRCTRKIKKMSPIDAVRNGQTGERFRKKSLIHLGKTKLGSTSFLAFNDTLSSPKQYSIITIVFSICALLIMILANTANTLNSENLLFLFGTTKSDIYYQDATKSIDLIGGRITVDDANKEVERILADNGFDATVHSECLYKIPVKHKGHETGLLFQQCKDTKADEYVYTEGTAPQHENEIALTKQVADKLEASIGDSVKLTVNGEEKDYIVTAFFQTFNQLGEIGRIHQDVDVSNIKISNLFPFQIEFNDYPDAEEIENRIDKVKEIFDTKTVYDAQEFVKTTTGASDIINSVKNLVLVLTIIIIAMITILMERSFISKEKAEIALMKALGFKNSSIIAHHTIRFAITSVLANILAIILCMPFTKLLSDPVFGVMGAVGGIEYKIVKTEIFVLYPVVVIAVTILSAMITALYTCTIKASDTADIE